VGGKCNLLKIKSTTKDVSVFVFLIAHLFRNTIGYWLEIDSPRAIHDEINWIKGKFKAFYFWFVKICSFTYFTLQLHETIDHLLLSSNIFLFSKKKKKG
jgi:hypothetical protein